jgi:uncharacterized delta-60 repeat protein
LEGSRVPGIFAAFAPEVRNPDFDRRAMIVRTTLPVQLRRIHRPGRWPLLFALVCLGWFVTAPVLQAQTVNRLVRAILEDAEGRLLIGGSFTQFNAQPRESLARVLADGTLDTNFVAQITAPLTAAALSIDAEGRIVVGGDLRQTRPGGGGFQRNVTRLMPDGGRDATFTGAGTDGSVLSVAHDAEGRIYVGGEFGSANGIPWRYLARLLPNGDLDTNFVAHPSGPVSVIRPLPGGQCLIGGAFDSVNGIPRGRIARLRADGSVDPDFAAGAGFSGGSFSSVDALALRPTGEILVGGSFTAFDGTALSGLAQLNSSGRLTPGFDAVSLSPPVVHCLHLLADGLVLVGGSFTNVAGAPAPSLIGLRRDGSRDEAPPEVSPGPSTLAVTVARDGALWIGGTFQRVAGQSRPWLARIPLEPSTPVLRLTLIEAPGIVFGFRFPTVGGTRYRIEARDSLGSAAWRTLAEFVGSGADHTYRQGSWTSAEQFFRVVAEPASTLP